MFGIFPLILGCIHHPNWRTIFFRGVAQPPTSCIMWKLLKTVVNSHIRHISCETSEKDTESDMVFLGMWKSQKFISSLHTAEAHVQVSMASQFVEVIDFVQPNEWPKSCKNNPPSKGLGITLFPSSCWTKSGLTLWIFYFLLCHVGALPFCKPT